MRVGDRQLQVLGRVRVDERERRVPRVGLDDRHRLGVLQLGLDPLQRGRVGADQDGLGAGAVLGLRPDVPGDDRRGDAGVRQHDQLAGAGQRLDADLAEEAALGLLDVDVAGADDEIHLADRLGAQRQGSDRLCAADRVHLLDAEQRACGQHRAVGQAVGAGGEQTAMPTTPATWAGTTAITALEG